MKTWINRLVFCTIISSVRAQGETRRQDLPESEPQAVTIGVIVPLTGDMSVHGVEVRRAMELAAAEVKGGRYRYRLLFQDNRLEGARSVSAAQHLLGVEKADVLVTLWPPTALVVIPLSERAERLHYTISWDPDLARRNRLVLSHQAMVDNIAAATLQLLEMEGRKRVAFLHMEETGFNLGADELRRQLPNYRLEFAADEAFAPDERDFRPLLTRVERAKPDAYLIWAVMPSIDILVRQLRERRSAAIISGYLDYAQDLSQLEGSVYVSEMYAAPRFSAAFEERYGAAPISKGPNAYDIFNLLVWAYEQHTPQKPSAQRLKDTLRLVKDHAGAVGKFSIDSAGNSTYMPVRRKIQRGQRELLQP